MSEQGDEPLPDTSKPIEPTSFAKALEELREWCDTFIYTTAWEPLPCALKGTLARLLSATPPEGKTREVSEVVARLELAELELKGKDRRIAELESGPAQHRAEVSEELRKRAEVRAIQLEAEVERLQTKADAADKAAEWQAKDAAKARAEVERLQDKANEWATRAGLAESALEARPAMTEAEREWCLAADPSLSTELEQLGLCRTAKMCRALVTERTSPPKRTMVDVNVDCMQARNNGKNLDFLQSLFDERRRLLDEEGES